MIHRFLSLLPKSLPEFQLPISLEILCFDTLLKAINYSNFASNKRSRIGQYVSLLLSSSMLITTERYSTVQFKKPKKQVYDPRRGLIRPDGGNVFGKSDAAGDYRGRSTLRAPDGVGSSFVRSLSV